MHPNPQVRRAATAVYDNTASQDDRILVIDYIRTHATYHMFPQDTMRSIHTPCLLENFTNESIWFLYETLLEL